MNLSLSLATQGSAHYGTWSAPPVNGITEEDSNFYIPEEDSDNIIIEED